LKGKVNCEERGFGWVRIAAMPREARAGSYLQGVGKRAEDPGRDDGSWTP
jgi:hypothetical protein